MKVPIRPVAAIKPYFSRMLKTLCLVIFFSLTSSNYLSALTTRDFFDDFKNGNKNWNLEKGWKIVKTGSNAVLEGTGHKWAVLKGEVRDNYALMAKFKLTKGTIHFNYRKSDKTSGTERYFIGVGENSIYLNKQAGAKFYDLAAASAELDGSWHTIDIRAYGGLINVFIDDVLYIIYQDKSYIKSGGSAFETLEDTDCFIDDVKITEIGSKDVVIKPKPGQTSITSGIFIPDSTNSGDLVLKGNEVKTIENMNFLQQGNVYINDEAKLIIRNSRFMLGRGDLPTIHTYITVGAEASMEIINSAIIPECPKNKMGALAVIRNYGDMKINDSPTEIHLLEMYDNAQLSMLNSKMVYSIGGLLQIHGGSTKVANSTIGALGLSIPEDARLDIGNIKSGVYYDKWDVHKIIPEANYNLVFEKTSILKDEFEPGPYERGWLFFPDPDAHVRIGDSELRKVFIEVNNDNATFANLRIGKPSSLKYKDIELDKIIMRGQWPFVLNDSNVTISNSDYLFLQPGGRTSLTLINSHMVEFIPRDFTGIIQFDNCTWTNAGEIVGGQSYHSLSNHFTITGSLKIAPELKEHLQWQDAQVTREYDAVITNQSGKPMNGALVKISGKTCISDSLGKVKFSLSFDQYNYNKPEKLAVYKENKLITQKNIDFFTDTPVLINGINTK